MASLRTGHGVLSLGSPWLPPLLPVPLFLGNLLVILVASSSSPVGFPNPSCPESTSAVWSCTQDLMFYHKAEKQGEAICDRVFSCVETLGYEAYLSDAFSSAKSSLLPETSWEVQGPGLAGWVLCVCESVFRLCTQGEHKSHLPFVPSYQGSAHAEPTPGVKGNPENGAPSPRLPMSAQAAADHALPLQPRVLYAGPLGSLGSTAWPQHHFLSAPVQLHTALTEKASTMGWAPSCPPGRSCHYIMAGSSAASPILSSLRVPQPCIRVNASVS
ncbi:hypothetical protein H1C71_015033 [Ictidomys tridecemlineatus]|nr:hypothetical protein H1C71_015033 [Ictidomys tridecemlineatus]